MINLRPGVWLPQDDSRLRVLESGIVDAPETRASTITADQPAVHHRRRAVRHEAVRPEHDSGSEDASPVELARVNTAEVEKFYNIARGTLTGDEGTFELTRVNTAEIEKFYNVARGTLVGDEITDKHKAYIEEALRRDPRRRLARAVNVIKAARAIQPQSTLADATDRFLGGPAAEVLDELDLQIKSLQILQELDLECNVEAELADAHGVQDALRTHGSLFDPEGGQRQAGGPNFGGLVLGRIDADVCK